MKNRSRISVLTMFVAASYPLCAQSAPVAAAGSVGSSVGGHAATTGSVGNAGVNGPAAGGSVANNGVNGPAVGGSVATGGVNGPTAVPTPNTNAIATPNAVATPNPTMNTGNTGAATNWNNESAYWRSNYPNRTYYNRQRDFSTYEPAYHYGVDLYNQNGGKPYNELSQSQIVNGWNSAHGTSNLDWSDAQAATRDAYDRMYQINHNGTNGTAATTVNGVAVTSR